MEFSKLFTTLRIFKDVALDKALIAREPVFTIGDETANVRNIGIQLKDASGENCKFRQPVRILVMEGSTEALATTGGSTGIELDANGLLVDTPAAKQVFDFITDVTGLLTLTWTDTATESVRLRVILPDGTMRDSAAFANA